MRAVPLVLACLVLSACRSEPTATATGDGTGAPPKATKQAEAPAEPADTPPTPAPVPAAPSDPSEVAFLAGFADIPAMTQELAKACDGKDIRACLRLVDQYAEGVAGPHDSTRAHELADWICAHDPSGHGCWRAGSLGTADGSPSGVPAATVSYRTACERDHPLGCLAGAQLLEKTSPEEKDAALRMRARACSAGFAVACPDGQTPGTTAKPSLHPEAVCPIAFHFTTSQSGGPRLHGTFEALDPETLLGHLPKSVRGYESSGRNATPAGRAGTRTASATASFTAPMARTLQISVMDRAADCTLQPGTGATMLKHAIASGATAAKVGNHDGATQTQDHGASISVWLADRCTLHVSGTGHDPTSITEAAATLPLDAIEKTCAARPGSLLLPPHGR